MKISDFESGALAQFCVGDSDAMVRLRCQVDRIRLSATRSIRKSNTLLGELSDCYRILMRRYSERAYTFDLAWGDLALGDRRQIVIDDVVAELDSGEFLPIELHIRSGIIQKLKALGIRGREKSELREVRSVGLSSFVVKQFWFINSNRDALGYENLDSARIADYYPLKRAEFAPSNAFEEWLVDLEHCKVVGGIMGPTQSEPITWGIGLAKSATLDEICALEMKHNIVIPDDLRSFWRFSNGLSFLGEPICGTYDTSVSMWRDRQKRPLVSFLTEDAQTTYVRVAMRGEKGSELGSIVEYENSDREEVRKWPSLRAWFEQRIGERSTSA